MSAHGQITVPCWDGDYTFRMAYGELLQLEEACDLGAPLIAASLETYDPIKSPRGDSWRVSYIRETLRIGLTGAGKTQLEALNLVRRFVEPALLENRQLAYLAIRAGIEGSLIEPVGKAPGAAKKKMKATGSRTAGQPSSASSELPV